MIRQQRNAARVRVRDLKSDCFCHHSQAASRGGGRSGAKIPFRPEFGISGAAATGIRAGHRLDGGPGVRRRARVAQRTGQCRDGDHRGERAPASY